MDKHIEIQEQQEIPEPQEQPYHFCKDMLGLCFTSPDCEQDQYFHAYSFNRVILDQMIKNVKDDERDFYSIKKIKVQQYLVVNKSNDTDKFFDSNNVTGILLRCDNTIYNEKINPLYGYNFIKNGLCEQTLLSIKPNIITDYIRENGISDTPLKIDTFYEESILNA